MRSLVSAMFRELSGNSLLLAFGFWSAFTSYALLDHGWLRYIEPVAAIAWIELVLAFLIIPFGCYLFCQDVRHRVDVSGWGYFKELVAGAAIICFGIWSASTFWEITHVGWSEYAGWPTWAALAWFSAAELMFILGIDRWADDLRRFRRLRGGA